MAACDASPYMRITSGEHYRRMKLGLYALLTSLQLNYAAQGSRECARNRPLIGERLKTLRRSAAAPPEVSI